MCEMLLTREGDDFTPERYLGPYPTGYEPTES